jgi:hypothetical protein
MKNDEQSASGAKTNEVQGSLIKVVLKEENKFWKSPDENQLFSINEDALFPEITFEIDVTGVTACKWEWEITWAAATSGSRESKKRGRVLKHFSEKGHGDCNETKWIANLDQKCLGGVLKVTAIADGKKFTRHARIIAVNPTEEMISDFLSTFEDIPGLDRIIKNESKFKQFINADGEPIVSFDGGFGLTQMTNPKPSYSEAWNWKDNIRAGVKLYRQKRKEAQTKLSGGRNKQRPYTEEQLQLETWCRWNSGTYHIWDEVNGQWIRDPTILGDTKTGNIGWDKNNPENKGKTEEILHERDKSEYSKPRTSKSSWRYSGVVYADHIKND